MYNFSIQEGNKPSQVFCCNGIFNLVKKNLVAIKIVMQKTSVDQTLEKSYFTN